MGTHQLPTLNNSDTFEDAICDLFNLIESTFTYKKFGKKGHNQKGIDVFSTEKNCAIQCKKKDLSRKESLIRKEIFDNIENDVKKVLHSDLKIIIDKLIFTSTYKDHPEIDEFCESIKEELNTDFEIVYWGWETLEGKFISEQLLIEKYWPNFIYQVETKESTFKRHLDLKKQIKKDFSSWLNYVPEKRQLSSKVILRAFDGTQYPKTNEPDEFGEYSWFRAEIKSLYFKGFEFIIGTLKIEVFQDNTWDYYDYDHEPKGTLVNVAKVGQVNFKDIVDYDVEGDEYYLCPIVFCKFINKGTPFENCYLFSLEKNYIKYELTDERM